MKPKQWRVIQDFTENNPENRLAQEWRDLLSDDVGDVKRYILIADTYVSIMPATVNQLREALT